MQVPRSARNRFVLGFTLLLVLASSTGAAHGSGYKAARTNKHADHEVIVGMEAQWRTALMQGDAALLDRLLSDDFLSISSNGTLADKQGYLHGVASHQHTFTKLNITETKIRIQPSSAIVTSRAVIEGRVDGAPIRGVFRYTRVYGKTAGIWKVMNFEATRVSGAGSGVPDLHTGVPMPR